MRRKVTSRDAENTIFLLALVSVSCKPTKISSLPRQQKRKKIEKQKK